MSHGPHQFNPHQYQDLLLRNTDIYARAKYEYMVASFRGVPPMRILNVGCGSGELSFLLAAEGHAVVGIDPVPAYIDLARSMTPPALTERCAFTVHAIETMPLTETFDAIVSSDVLEHIEDDRAAVKRLAALLRPGGSMVISVPALPLLFGYHDEILGHYRRYTKATLSALVERTNQLSVISARYFGFFFILPGLLFNRFLRKDYPTQAYTTPKGKQSIWSLSTLVRIALKMEQAVHFPLGTNLIMTCRKRND